MNTTLRANGKLLISGEYMVMYGSKALALPLLHGQTLHRIKSENPRTFSWNAMYENNTWFHAILNPSTLAIVDSSDPEKAELLRSMIMACIEMMPSFQEDLFRWDVETVLDFSPQWGFGSSSTLTALMAEWAEVNPLDLHFMTSEGSGYDVACAVANGPIQYRIRDDEPHYQHIPFKPAFADQLYFAWLGSKQPTQSHLEEISDSLNPGYEHIHHFSTLTDSMINAQDLSTFQALMEEHEEALSKLLKMERVSHTRLKNIPGAVKSLGAWGGDFVMIASDADEQDLFDRLAENNIQIIFRYNDLVLDGIEL